MNSRKYKSIKYNKSKRISKSKRVRKTKHVHKNKHTRKIGGGLAMAQSMGDKLGAMGGKVGGLGSLPGLQGNATKGLDMAAMTDMAKFGKGAMKMQIDPGDFSIIKQVTSSIAFVVGNILGFPFKHIEQIIPENVCKDYISNPALCNQNMSEFLITGTKKDFGKLLSEEDKAQCLELDDMNHIVKCKRKKFKGSVVDLINLATGGPAMGAAMGAAMGPAMGAGMGKGMGAAMGQRGGANSEKVKAPQVFKYSCGNSDNSGKGKRKFALGDGNKDNSKENSTENSKDSTNPHLGVTEPTQKIIFKRKSTLKHLRERFVHLNMLLRKYECPKSKLKSILKLVNDKVILIKIKDILTALMSPSQYTKSKDTAESLQNRKKCDALYNKQFANPAYKTEEFGLKILPELKHVRFTTSMNELATGKCDGCSPWDVLGDKYFELVYYSMMGDKKSIYVLVHFIHDVLILKKYEMPQDDSQDIFEDIRVILDNIQCRSDVIGILDELIAKL